MKATFYKKIIAQSDGCKEVENNQYFPPESVDNAALKKSNTTSQCPWKGQARYYDVVVGGIVEKDAAWYYPDPLPKAKALGLTNYVAFWKGVVVSE